MIFSSVANLQRSASASAGGVGTRQLIFWRQFFPRLATSSRILRINGEVRRKGQGGSKAICCYDFLFPRYGRVLRGDRELDAVLVFVSTGSSQLEAKTLRAALQ